MDEYWSDEAHDMIKTYWGLELHIPICLNARFTKTLGTYEYKIEDGKIIPIRIQLSKELVKHGSHHFIRFILKHELCHFVLSIMNIPFGDGDDEFENELKRIGAFSTKCITMSYRIRCTKCQNILHFPKKKLAFSHMKEMKCSCEFASFEPLDVYYNIT